MTIILFVHSKPEIEDGVEVRASSFDQHDDLFEVIICHLPAHRVTQTINSQVVAYAVAGWKKRKNKRSR